MKQVEAVFNAICEIKGANEFDSKVELTKEEMKEVVERVASGMERGEVDLSEKARTRYDSPEKLRNGYVSGMVNNHLRKDKRLNGGEAYQPKNPGIRQGSGDKVIRELKKLQKKYSDNEDLKAELQNKIDERIQHLAAQKNQSIEIDASILEEAGLGDLLKMVK